LKRKRDIFVIIFSVIIGLCFIYYNTSEILSNKAIDWFEMSPYLWLFVGVFIIAINLVLFFKTQLFFAISVTLMFCLVSYFFIESSNKPNCNLTYAYYIYRGKVKNNEVGNSYSIYLKKLDCSIYNLENDLEEINEYVSLKEIYGNAKNRILKNVYNDSLKNKDSSDVTSFIKSTLRSSFVKDSTINEGFETNGTAQLLTDNKFKTVKYLEKVTAVLYKNGEFYRYKVLAVTPNMITDSAGIVIVNFGDIDFE